MSDKQPAALRLADNIEAGYYGHCPQAAAELRRLHAENERLREALEICVCAMQDYQAGIGITDMFDKGERLARAALAKETK